jgi:hypothetical protein
MSCRQKIVKFTCKKSKSLDILVEFSIGCLLLCPCSSSVYWVSTSLSMFYQCLLGVYISVHVLPVSIECLHLCPCSTSVYWVSTFLSMFYQYLLCVYISAHVLPVSIGCLHLCPCSTSVYWVSTSLSMFYQCLLGFAVHNKQGSNRHIRQRFIHVPLYRM